MQVNHKNYPHLNATVGLYVHAVSYNGLLFVSGLTAFNTPAQNADLATQAKAIFAQIKSILEAENANFNHLLKVMIFVTELEVEQLRNVLFSYIFVTRQYLPSFVHMNSQRSNPLDEGTAS